MLCHSNLTRQALRDDLTELDVENFFLCTGFAFHLHYPYFSEYFIELPTVGVGDCIEFLAEIDLLVYASPFLQGGASLACGRDSEPVVYPLGAQVWKPDVFNRWRVMDASVSETVAWSGVERSSSRARWTIGRAVRDDRSLRTLSREGGVSRQIA